MKTLKLNSNQVITLNDYPVYSDRVLNEYFSKCKLGEKLPFVPVIKKDMVKKHLDGKVLKEFKKFENENKAAEYFMLDGSHRTTALTLAGCKIVAIIYEKDEDIREAKKLTTTGKISKDDTLNHTLKENCEMLNSHFNNKFYFMTVGQKTKKMIEEKILPQFMINSYKKMKK